MSEKITGYEFTFLLDGRESTFKIADTSAASAEVKLREYFAPREVEVKSFEAGKWTPAGFGK